MIIRKMTVADSNDVVEMMKVFYASPAVSTNGSDEIFAADVENCTNENPYLEGYVFDEGGINCGYAMLAKSFSTEFGRPCIWIEDLYIKEEYRGRGIARDFLELVSDQYSGRVIRLEVEDDNTRAVKIYKSNGFDNLPYAEMFKL